MSTTSGIPAEIVDAESKKIIHDPNDIYVLVNKANPLNIDYLPSDLVIPSVSLRLNPEEEQMQVRKIITSDLEKMFYDAARSDILLVLSSGYRSSKLQNEFFVNYSAESGEAEAEKFSARPGYSEHQTGLAVDIINKSNTCDLEECFENTKEGKWLENNSYLYGFILRYPKNKQQITQYNYEPWHFRYVGKSLAAKINKNRITLEEYFSD